MLLGGCWVPGMDAFVTAGRDKCVKVWRKTGGWECVWTVRFEVPVTAVGFLDRRVDGGWWLGVGREDGGVEVYKVLVEEEVGVERVVRLDDG